MVIWKQAPLDRFVERRVTVAVGKMSRDVRSSAKKLVGRQNKSRGSKPPKPPFKKTGELQRSIMASKPAPVSDGISAIIGPTATRHGRPYGLFLEVGFLLKGITEEDGSFHPVIPHQMQAPRPFMRPALDKLKGTWQRHWL